MHSTRRIKTIESNLHFVAGKTGKLKIWVHTILSTGCCRFSYFPTLGQEKFGKGSGRGEVMAGDWVLVSNLPGTFRGLLWEW